MPGPQKKRGRQLSTEDVWDAASTEAKEALDADGFCRIVEGKLSIARRHANHWSSLVRHLEGVLSGLQATPYIQPSSSGNAVAPDLELSSSGRPAPRKRNGQSQVASVRREVARVLRQENRPMDRSELLPFLVAAGIELPQESPGKRIGKILWGAKEFVHVGSGYWFAGEPHP